MAYLITGATGSVGTLVVNALIERGERPRVFVRDKQKAEARYGNRVDVFTGDFSDAASLQPALRGSDAVYLVTSGPNLAALDALVASAAKAAGVQHLVKLSSFDAPQHVGTGVWHAQGEAAIRSSGIPFTLVQPSGFMSNALFWAKSIREESLVRSCTGDGKISFIHPGNIADVSVEVLTSGTFRGESLPITGPEALSYAEMGERIGAAIRKKVRFEPISEETVRQRMVRDGDSHAEVEAHLSIYRAIREGRLAKVTNTVEGTLGRKPATFDEWVAENLSVFASEVRV